MSKEEQAINIRKRCILYLIDKYLMDMGLQQAASTLRTEAYISNDYEICDNIDLDTIYLEYCSYYHLKYEKYPKILKHTIKNEKNSNSSDNKKLKKKKSTDTVTNSVDKNVDKSRNELLDDFKVVGLPTIRNNENTFNTQNSITSFEFDMQEQILFNGDNNFNSEWKELARIVSRDLIKDGFNLKWENICGHKEAIDSLKESIILPLEHPEYFTGTLKPWKAILLYGPPGTGKTLLAKTVCSETFKKMNFFYVHTSTIISKWRGESEKMIRVLFEMSHYYAPSIIFFDEIDGITSKRDHSNEHEASKRFKNEFLSLLDNTENENKKHVFILANTNIPWDIDIAFLRRFEKKILISLPNEEERKLLIRNFLPNSKVLTDKVLSNLVIKCDGFTGDEIRIACKEAAMKQMRQLHKKNINKVYLDINSYITENDLLKAFDQIQPIGQKTINKYIEWSKQFGKKL